MQQSTNKQWIGTTSTIEDLNTITYNSLDLYLLKGILEKEYKNALHAYLEETQKVISKSDMPLENRSF